MTEWIDVHTHLNMLEDTPENILSRAQGVGIGRVITIGTCPDDLPTVIELADRYPSQVFCTLGIHPHEAELYSPAIEKYMRNNLSNVRVVAVGEIGLDYYYDHADRDVQRSAFRRQMELAEEFGLPVEIHTREAEDDTAAILEEFRGRVRGLLHCFTSSWQLAEKALDVGFHISISGVVTFKNAESLRETVKKIPLDRLHVETDAPFLTPVPHRGKKNEPMMMAHTAKVVADLKGVTLEKLSEQTLVNALDLFPRLKLS